MGNPSGKVVCLALDISTKTGWAVLEKDLSTQKISLVAYGIEKLPKKIDAYGEYPWNYPEATAAIADQILKIVSQTPADVIVIEEINKGKNRYTQKALDFIHLQVLQRLDAYRKKNPNLTPPVFYINTMDWRKKLGIALTKNDKANNKLVKKAADQGVKKASLGVKGKIKYKHLAVRHVNEIFGLSFKVKDNDIADAICQCEAYLLGAPICNGK